MKDKLCLIICDIYKEEILSVLHSENIENVVIETIPCICYKSYHGNVDEIKYIINRNSDECSQFEIIGEICKKELASLIGELENCHLYDLEKCFYLLTNKTIIDSFISEGNYLTTPGWLKHWKDYVNDWGFSKQTAAEFFRGYAKQVLLLDTGVDKQSAINLKDFSDFVGLPYKILEVGLDYLQMLLLKIINLYSVHQNANKCSSDFISINDKVRSLNKTSCTLTPIRHREIAIHDAAEIETSRTALEKSEKKYRKLIESLPEAVFVHDAYKILFCNKAALKLIGVESYNELIGKPILEFIPSKSHTALLKSFKKTLEGGEPVSLQSGKLIQSSGKVINIELTTAQFQFEERPAILHVMKDITERKQVEQMKKRMERNKRIMNEMLIDERLKTEFFANISHEFRTPLNVILGTLQLVELYQKSNSIANSLEVLNKYIPAMKQNCFRLLRLINNLIDITRIDSGYFEVHLENSDIVHIIKKIVLSMEEYVQAKNLTINFKTEIEEKIIACDPDKIERIILNLLSNAIKFTEPEGSITVNIYNQGDKIAIIVADTGIGIPKNKQNLVFDRFRQVDKSLTRKSEGSGIGLAIVKSLVEMHHGSITLKSIHNKGSEFTVLLPVKVLDKKGPSTAETGVQVIGNQVERIKIEFSDIYL